MCEQIFMHFVAENKRPNKSKKNRSTVAQMAARSLGNQFIAGDPSSNPAGSNETAISKLKPYCLLQHMHDVSPTSKTRRGVETWGLPRWER